MTHTEAEQVDAANELEALKAQAAEALRIKPDATDAIVVTITAAGEASFAALGTEQTADYPRMVLGLSCVIRTLLAKAGATL